MHAFLQDIRVGLRVLLKERSFFAIAVLVLALGIAGVTTQFSVINSALLRGLPFPDSDRLVRVALRDPAWAPGRTRAFWLDTAPTWSHGHQSVEGLAGYFVAGSFIVTIGDVPQRFSGAHVTDDFFALLGVRPALGRVFTPADNRPDAPRVTVISDSLWKSDFAHDPAILGRTIRLNGKIATVIGVMPPDFNFPRDQLWLPLFNEYTGNNPGPGNLIGGSFSVLARLKPGATLDQAAAEFNALAQRAARDFPATNQKLTEVVIEPLLNSFVGRDARQLMFLMLAAVAAVLVIACVNVMNLQFARAARRAKELAVRGALGASRARLIAQMLTESLLVAGAGGALGVLLAAWAVDYCATLNSSLPPWIHFEIDGTVLAFTVLATAISVFVSGLLPALIASRTDALDALKEGGRGHTNRLVQRVTGALVIGQIALTGALLIASLLLVKSVQSRHALDFGYDLGSVLAGRMNFETDYHDDDSLRAVQEKIVQHLRASPGFTHAAFTSRRNMMQGVETGLQLEGRDRVAARAWLEFVSADYFATLGIHPLQGREFGVSDTADRPPVALVNATFAQKYFGRENSLGRRIRADGADDPWLTVVGVVPDTLMQGPLDAHSDGAGIFVPTSIAPAPYMTLVVRGRTGPARLADALRREILQVNPNLAIYAINTPEGFLRSAIAPTRAATTLFSVFGLVAVILSVVGLYGVATFSVSQRTQEFGVRIALGATPGRIMALVLRQGAVRFSAGTGLGLMLAFALTQIGGAAINDLLYKTSPHDPATYGIVTALLAVATLFACFVPARRATKVDPMTALRAE
jgi:putative ABC transport system permease protein